MSGSDGAGVLRIPEIYKTDALASPWGCPKIKLQHENEQGDIPREWRSTVPVLWYMDPWAIPSISVRCTLKIGSRETRKQQACWLLRMIFRKAFRESLQETPLVLVSRTSVVSVFN
ncbi:hypothetical protein Tco_1086612 [Tanacetum coccineum]